MTVDKALEIVTKIISNSIEEYDQSPDSTDDTGTRIAHPLDIIDEGDKLFSLDMSLKDVALKASPISLIETTGSTASELRRVSTDYFIRVPVEPLVGNTLDIDDGLSYAVVFKALGSIWSDYAEYVQKADSIVNTYIQAYRVYLADLIEGNVGVGAETYIRFSANGTDWHDSFTTGDTYISFKKIDTDTWTPAIQFVGSDGTNGSNGTNGSDGTNFDDTLTYTGNAGKVVAVNATEDGIELIAPTSGGGSGATTFAELTDTPSSLTVGKYLKVNANGDALEFVDVPTGSGGGLAGANVFGDKVFFDDTSSGVINLDASTNNVFYLYPSANAELHFTQFDDDGTQVDALWGTTYTFMLVSASSVSITFDPNLSILGDVSVPLGTDSTNTGITMTMLTMVYSGYDWYVVSRNVITDANG